MNYLIILTLIPIIILAMGFAGIPLPFISQRIRKNYQDAIKSESEQLFRHSANQKTNPSEAMDAGRTRIIKKLNVTTEANKD